MKKIVTASGKFGPYESIEILDDRYRVDGPADLPFSVIGEGVISDVEDGDFPPVVYVPQVIETTEPTKEELLAQLLELQSKIESLG